LLRIERATDAADASAMADQIDQLWEATARKRGMHRGDPDTWVVTRPDGFAGVLPPDAFAAMASPTVTAVLDTLLPGGWRRPAWWDVPLITFPSRDAHWEIIQLQPIGDELAPCPDTHPAAQ
jgi:hypothetical protein